MIRGAKKEMKEYGETKGNQRSCDGPGTAATSATAQKVEGKESCERCTKRK